MNYDLYSPISDNAPLPRFVVSTVVSIFAVLVCMAVAWSLM